MPVSRLFEDYYFYKPETLVQTLCDRIKEDGVEDVRSEFLRRLEAGTLPLELGVALVACFNVKPSIHEIRRVFRSPSATDDTRLIAYTALAGVKANLLREMESLGPDARDSLIANLHRLKEALAMATGGGGPFRALVRTDRNDEAAVEHQATAIVQAFLESSHAEEVEDREQAAWWIQEFLVVAYTGGLGTPMTMSGADVEDALSELMPLKVSVESEEEALPAIPALGNFFLWVAEATKVAVQESVYHVLTVLEPYFPAMILGGARFGPARGFITAGMNAGFDLSTEEGLSAFEDRWNRDHAIAGMGSMAPPLPARKLRAKKRKAKMEKASRRKNRKK
jgi:hypothetical protein